MVVHHDVATAVHAAVVQRRVYAHIPITIAVLAMGSRLHDEELAVIERVRAARIRDSCPHRQQTVGVPKGLPD
jgi:hypothetical protein